MWERKQLFGKKKEEEGGVEKGVADILADRITMTLRGTDSYFTLGKINIECKSIIIVFVHGTFIPHPSFQ